MKNEYDTRAALLAIAFKMDKSEPFDLRQTLADLSDIPEDRLDFAISEIGQVLDGLRAMVDLFRFVIDDDDARRVAIENLVAKAKWIDDTKGNLTVGVEVQDGEGTILAKAKVKTKMKS